MADEATLAALGSKLVAMGLKADASSGELDEWLKTKGESKPMGNVLMTGPGLPRLPNFNGDSGEASFAHWVFEIQCLKKEGYAELQILNAVRRSVRGQAAEVVLQLGEKCSLTDLLQKFEVIFGDVLPEETMLESFFSSRQHANENVASWGCRLEALLKKATKTSSMGEEAQQSMLLSKFWSGLRDPNLKMALRHVMGEAKDFSKLLKQARMVEDEFIHSKPVRANAQLEDKQQKVLEEIRSELQAMGQRLTALEESQSSLKQEFSKQQNDKVRKGPACFRCGSTQHLIKQCAMPKESGNKWGPTDQGSR